MQIQTKPKESVIRFRIEKDIHDRFKTICTDKAINASELFRQLLEKWISKIENCNERYKKPTARHT